MKTMKKLLTMLTMMVLLCMSVGFVSAATTTTIPSKVTGLKQTEGDADSVKIAWNPADGCTEGIYHVQRSSDKVTWTDVDDAYSCSETVRSLAAGQTLYVRVAAYSGYTSSTLGEYSDPFEVVTSPGQVKEAVQSAATADSVTLSWTALEGSSSYHIYAEDKTTLVTTAATNSVTIGGLTPNYSATFYVAAVKTSASGYTASDGYTYTDVTAKTVPAQMSKDAFGISHYWTSLKELNFEFNTPQNADGTELCVYEVSSKKPAYTKTSESVLSYFKYNENTAYKYRARAYVMVGGQKVYGPWSSYRYVGTQKVTYTTKGRNIKLNWKKVKGASSYVISVSKSENSGYKKVAKLSSKKTSYTVKKFGKKKFQKNTTYYVRVRPVIKVGKKSYKSDAWMQVSIKF